MGKHVVGGGYIEGHQTLVVIDQSNFEEPILWYYDPKGRDPNENQKDARAPSETIPERLEKIQQSFEEKLGKKIQKKQLKLGANPDQSLFNTTHCVYLCAGTAMDLVLGKESEFSGNPKKIVQKVNEELDRAFVETSE